MQFNLATSDEDIANGYRAAVCKTQASTCYEITIREDSTFVEVLSSTITSRVSTSPDRCLLFAVITTV